MAMITSAGNERIKALRKLHERKHRQESGLFLVEGLRIVAEAAELGAEIDTLIAAPELLKSDFGLSLVDAQRARGVPLLEVSAEVFQRLSVKEGPQGLAAVVRQRWLPLEAVRLNGGQPSGSLSSGTLPSGTLPSGSGTWVVLASVADPGNLGTILRTHDAVGGQGVILLDQSTDPYDPSAVRASMGALFAQQLVRATFDEFAGWKRRGGYSLVGTSDKAAEDYHAFRYPPKLLLFMGSERQGLTPDQLALCDAVVSIPMLGRSDSLNLSAATAVVLYEILNQRRDKR